MRKTFLYILVGITMLFNGLFVNVAYAEAPLAPSELRAVSGNETVFLSWPASFSNLTNLLGYRLYVSTDDINYDVLKALPGSPPVQYYEVTGLENGQEYTFAITSYNAELEESDKIYSDTVIPAMTALTDSLPPENISDLVISAGDGSVNLSWKHSADTQNDLVGYNVYISTDGGLTFKEGRKVGYVDAYKYTGLTNGQSYVFKITAYDEVPNESIGVTSSEIVPNEDTVDEVVEGIELSGNLPQTDTFTDVNSDNVFKSFIEFLAARDVIKGYSDGTFGPDKNLTRGEAVKIILTATGTGDLKSVSETSFSDVSPQNPLAPYIEEAFFYNIVRGYGGGVFKPDEPVLRKEFTKMFMEATQGTMQNPVTKAVFSDVSLDNIFAKWIYSAYKKGYINGYDDGTFHPNDKITRAEASKVVARYLQGVTEQVPENTNLELHLLSLINSSRLDHGLSTLTIDSDLSIVARNHSRDLAENVKAPSDLSSDGKTLFSRLSDAGIGYSEASENVAKVSIATRTKFEAVEILHSTIMNLPDNEPNQKANLLSTYKNFSQIGVGITEDEASQSLYIVVDLVVP